MFRIAMCVLCLCVTTVSFGGEVLLRAVKADGKTMTIVCTIEGDGSTNEAEIIEALPYIDAEIDISKADVTKDASAGKITIKVPSKAAFNMVETETRLFAFAGTKVIERHTRTYNFIFKEGEPDETETTKQLETFIKNTVKLRDTERSMCLRSPASPQAYSVVLSFDSDAKK